MKYFGFVILLIVLSFLFIPLFSQDTSDPILYEISVVGNVKNPGIYHLPPSSRVSEAILKANFSPVLSENTDQTQNQNINETENAKASTRNIMLTRNEKTIHLDLEKYFTLGATENNPYIADGDIIYVPVQEKTISIVGAVNKPGNYELISGDKISDIIDLAFGLRADAYLEKGKLVRFKDNHTDTETLNFNIKNILHNSAVAENYPLENDDRIYIRSIPEFHEKNSVTVFGEVIFSGDYSIEDGKTTLLEILQKCGGPTSKADLENAFIQRKSKEEAIDPEFERLKKMFVKDMTSLEYEYFKTKSRELRGKFSIDFDKLWNDKNSSYDVPLKNEDFISFPRRISTVSVSGQVKNPGLITFVSGKNYFYYIEQAGGFSWNPRKNKIRIIRASTGEWVKPNKKTVIEVGDMIFIPEKPEFDYWEFAKDFMGITAQIATVFIVIKNAVH